MSRRVATDIVRSSNVITFPVDCTNHEHPASFPLALPTFFIKAMSEAGDVVLDPFAGSGTTLLAAKTEGRRWIGFEIIPKYVDIINARLSENEVTALPDVDTVLPARLEGHASDR